MTSRYNHIQRVPDKVMAGAGLAGLVLGLTPPGMLMRLVLLATLGTAAVTFRCLTVDVDEDNVNLKFGDGFIKRSLPLNTIESALQIRTRPIQGWGIHWLGDGWLYNVYGLDAVEVRFKDGKRAVIGSDDAERLAAAINEALPETAEARE